MSDQDADAEIGKLRTALAEYENAITWDTTCLNCAHLLDQCYAETRRAEQAEERGQRIRALADEARRGYHPVGSVSAYKILSILDGIGVDHERRT